jgi:hypothetical protein
VRRVSLKGSDEPEMNLAFVNVRDSQCVRSREVDMSLLGTASVPVETSHVLELSFGMLFTTKNTPVALAALREPKPG